MLGLALVAALPLAGCTSDADPKPDPTRVSTSAFRLVAFDSCERLAKDLRAAAQEAVGPWGFAGDVRPALDGGARTAAEAAPDNAPLAGKAAAPEFSGTNVHEQGADEPDIVKTDGRRIVTVDGRTLRVVDAASRRPAGKLDLGTVGDANLLLAGDRALVLISDGFSRGATTKRYPPDDGAFAGPQVLLVDLAGTPRIISRFEGEGRLVDARQTGTVARVVLRTAPRITFPEPVYYGDGSAPDEDKLTEANRRVIGEAPADAWLPGWTVTTGRTVDKGRVGCGQVSRPPAYSGTSMVSVHTFDLSAPSLGGGDPVGVVADGDTVYGTPASLYIANDQRWRLDVWRGRANRATTERTEIYRFDITGAAKPVYAAAGTVPGWLVNQYALSEWDGRLRVATTLDSKQVSAVRVLERTGDELKQVGVVDGLGKGERIYSVRFIGPRGYVVTFRQTDPLYSVDLSDPAKPRVTGELKITGYSAHLQPAGDGRLLGIGQEATADGVAQGTQVSLFDVSDPAAPRRLAQHHMPRTQSEAEWDPHALLWWPKTGTLVLPTLAYGPAIRALPNAATVLRVTDDGIAQTGVLAQPAGAEGEGEWAPGIRRSLVVGDTLWTMSDYGLMASDLSTLNRVGWVPND
jgi:hypothetical protein